MIAVEDYDIVDGDIVFHRRFGGGLVIEVRGGTSALVNFETAGQMNLNLIELSRHPYEPGGDRLPTITAASFSNSPRPTREFVDDAGLIPCRNVTLLFGDGGTGKSLLTLQLACGVTVTGAWIGQTVRRGPVVYYSAEDDADETHIRLAEIAEADGFPMKAAVDLHIAVMAGKDAILANEQAREATLKWTKLYSRLIETLDKIRPVLLILDNLVDAFAGNQNNTALARQFIGKLRGLAITHNCAVVVLAHPSQSGMNSGDGQAGARAWSNSARSRLYFHRDIEKGSHGSDDHEPNPNRRWLDTMKSNYGPAGGRIGLEWQSGRFIRTDKPAKPGGMFDGMARMAKAERVFLELVDWHERHSINISPATGRNYAPLLFARHANNEGVRKRDFEAAMAALLDQGGIHVHVFGPDTRKQRTLVRTSSNPEE